MMSEWQQKVYSRRPGGIFLNQKTKRVKGCEHRTVLVLDSWRPHRKPEFIRKMSVHYDTQVMIIPGGMTPVLQPADISWNRPVKLKIKELWGIWMTEQMGLKSEERHNRPPYRTIAEWCLQAWKELDRDLIKRSFVFAGIGNERDDTKLSSKLLDIILNGIQEELVGLPNTGISDDETDSEEITETMDFVRSSLNGEASLTTLRMN